MSPPMPGQTPGDSGFATTSWTEVRNAASLDARTSESLQQLCSRYWYPLYCFLRRDGLSAEQAEDGVQSFFADLLSRNSLKSAAPERGKFRTFLLTACKNHVANLRRAELAQRRGGNLKRVPFQTPDGEQRYSAEPTTHWSPEKQFLRQWALATIDGATERLRLEYETKGRQERFDALIPLIAPAEETSSLAEIAEQLGLSVGAVKVAAHRLRQHFAAALRDEIAATLDEPDADDSAIDDELKMLMAALRE